MSPLFLMTEFSCSKGVGVGSRDPGQEQQQCSHSARAQHRLYTDGASEAQGGCEVGGSTVPYADWTVGMAELNKEFPRSRRFPEDSCASDLSRKCSQNEPGKEWGTGGMGVGSGEGRR